MEEIADGVFRLPATYLIDAEEPLLVVCGLSEAMPAERVRWIVCLGSPDARMLHLADGESIELGGRLVRRGDESLVEEVTGTVIRDAGVRCAGHVTPRRGHDAHPP